MQIIFFTWLYLFGIVLINFFILFILIYIKLQSLNHALQWAVPFIWPSHTARIRERTVCHSYMFTLYAFDFMWVHSKFSMCFYCETHGVKHLPFLRVLIPQCWGECNLPLSGHVSEPPDKCREASLQSSRWQEQTLPVHRDLLTPSLPVVIPTATTFSAIRAHHPYGLLIRWESVPPGSRRGHERTFKSVISISRLKESKMSLAFQFHAHPLFGF